MATLNVDITAAAANLVTSHSLVDGTRYTLQNVDANARVFLREAAVAPSGGALRGHVLEPGGVLTVVPSSGIGVWVWSDRSDGARAVITEAP